MATRTPPAVDAPESVSPDGRSRRRPLAQRLGGKHPIGVLFATPYAVFWVALFAYPIGFALYMSFHEYFFAAPGAIVDRPFIGLGNYAAALSDPSVQQAAINVVVFLVINVPLTVALGLGLATVLNMALPGRTFFRASYYVPYVTASVAMVGVWLWLFSGPGLVNQVLGGLAPEPTWLVNATWAMPIIALFATWKQLGFYVVLYLASLQNISATLYEAAAVDGAGPLRRFWSVTVPGVRNTTALVVILALITGANFFTEPYLLTGGGGPAGATVSPVLIMYQQGIQQGDAGYAAAIGVILVLVVMVLSLINRRLIEED